MSSKLNMQDIVDLLVANNEISKEEADKFVVELFSLIGKGLSTDELAKVKDFGTFKLTHIQERESVDVNTQEKIVIPAHRRVSFLPAQTLKSLVNKPFAHFETTPLNDGIFIDGINQDSLSDKDEEDDNDNEIEERDYQDRAVESESTIEDDIDKVASIAIITEGIESSEDDSEVKQEDLAEPIPISILSTDDNKEEQEELPAQTPSSSPTIGSKMEKSAPVDNSIDDEEKEKESSEEIFTVDTTKKLKPKKPKSRGKLRRYILRWDIAIALFMIFAVGFAYNYYFATNNPCEKGIEKSEIPKPIKVVAPALSETPIDEPVAVVDSVETKKPTEAVKTVKMSPGRTLRLIALDKFGNREFWVYIYLRNKDKINNPDVVPIGMELALPNNNEYPMDDNNSEDVAKAKELGDQVMKGFW